MCLNVYLNRCSKSELNQDFVYLINDISQPVLLTLVAMSVNLVTPQEMNDIFAFERSHSRNGFSNLKCMGIVHLSSSLFHILLDKHTEIFFQDIDFAFGQWPAINVPAFSLFIKNYVQSALLNGTILALYSCCHI